MSEVLGEVFGGVRKMLSGKKFPQNVRGAPSTAYVGRKSLTLHNRRSSIPRNGRFDGVLRREVSAEQNGEAVGGRCHKADVHHYGIHKRRTRGRLASSCSVQADDPVFLCGRPLQLCAIRFVLSAFNRKTAPACA